METTLMPVDLLKIEDFYERAGKGKRLANYVIDLVVAYLGIMVIFVVCLLLAPVTMEALINAFESEQPVYQLYFYIFYALYMGFLETVFKGKSIGKFITKTRAVNLDGSAISAPKAFARGFFRVLPFCYFSALGQTCNPWQDRWTKTKVVNEL